MKKVIVLMTALMLAMAPVSAMAQPESGVSLPLAAFGSEITVQGKASVYAEPDRATITFGVSAIDKEAAAAQSEVNKVLSEAVAAIKELGIAEKDIATDTVRIDREYDYSGSERKDRGFSAFTQLTVALDDVSKTGSVLDAALKAGVNDVQGVNFSCSRQSEYYDEALAAAVKNAQRKADVIAQAAGGSVSGIASVEEQSYGGAAYANTVNYSYDMAVAEGEAGTELPAGKIEISASVKAVFLMGNGAEDDVKTAPAQPLAGE